MKFFIGIVPPENIYNAIATIQQQFGDNRLEPHITLRAPVTPIDEINWIGNLRNVCNRVHPIQVQLSNTGNFGNRVLFIDVNSKGLAQLYKTVTNAIKPFEPVNEQDRRPYHPHLTLGRTWCGFTKNDFNEMQKQADAFLNKQPALFDVNYVRLYHKSVNNSRYEMLEDISLSVSK
jgi:2'-5' RNA ligase